MENKTDFITIKENGLVNSTLSGFRVKQGFSSCQCGFVNEESIVVFDGQFFMIFSDILLDIQLGVPKGIAVNYIQGFDLELQDGVIPKDLSYKDYLESKKLI